MWGWSPQKPTKGMTLQYFHTIPTSCAIVFVSCVHRRGNGCVMHVDVHELYCGWLLNVVATEGGRFAYISCGVHEQCWVCMTC